LPTTGGREILRLHQAQEVWNMREAVDNHPAASKLNVGGTL
jgi:hypothetical protein